MLRFRFSKCGLYFNRISEFPLVYQINLNFQMLGIILMQLFERNLECPYSLNLTQKESKSELIVFDFTKSNRRGYGQSVWGPNEACAAAGSRDLQAWKQRYFEIDCVGLFADVAWGLKRLEALRGREVSGEIFYT